MKKEGKKAVRLTKYKPDQSLLGLRVSGLSAVWQGKASVLPPGFSPQTVGSQKERLT